MDCASCGEQVEAGLRRCPSCYNYLSTEGPHGVHETELNARYCPRCGKKNAVRTTECERCGRGLEAFVPSATLVDERYMVLPEFPPVHRMGQLAIDIQREDVCVVKVGILLRCKTDEQREEAGRRLALTRNFEHANVMPMRDFSVHGRAGYVVFDHIKGRDLESVLVEEGLPWLPETRCIPMINQLLQGLEHVQSRRPLLVLTDLSPDSVLLGDDGRVWVVPLDWREARGDTRGRQPYRSPESFWNQPSTSWDVYGAGALLHHLLTGQAPISRAPWDFPPVRSFNASLSEEVERIVRRATSAEHERYTNCSHMSADIMVEYPELTHKTDWSREAPLARTTRPRHTETEVLTLTSPGRFSKMTAQESPVPGNRGRGLLKGPMPIRPYSGAFRPLRPSGMLEAPVEAASGGPEKPVDEGLAAEATARAPYARRSPIVHWTYGDYGSILPTIALTDRRVVVSTWDGELRGVSPKRGETLWSQHAPLGTWYNLTVYKQGVVGQVWSLPTRPEERPSFISMQFYNLTDGTFQWGHDKTLNPYTDGLGMSFSAAVGAYLLVLFVNGDKSQARLLALDGEGHAAWVRDFTGRTDWGGWVPDGVLLWNEHEGALLVDADSGHTRWFHRDLLVWRPQQDRAPYLLVPDGGDMVVLRDRSKEGLLSLVACSLPAGEVWWHRCVGPPVGSYLDAPPCLVTTAYDGVLVSIPWEYRTKFRHSVFCLDAGYGTPVWSADVRAPLQEIVPYGQDDAVFLASTPLKQTHLWGPFAYHRPELPCGHAQLETARARVGMSAMRALDATSGKELWRTGKGETESLSFRIRTNGRDVLAAASDGRLHAFIWPDDDLA